MSNAPTIINPCCFGVSLQSGAKIIAALQIGFTTLLFIVVTILLIILDSEPEEIGKEPAGFPYFLFFVVLIACAINVAFHVILFLGANQRDTKKIKIYLIFFCAIFGLSLLGLIQQIFTWGMIFSYILGEIPTIYQGYVVYRFHKELENDQPGGQQIC